MEFVNVDEAERRARERLDPDVVDYIAGGAEDETTLADNVAAWRRLRIVPRVLVDVRMRDLSSTALGRPVRLPVGVAPTSFHSMSHPDGEVATARAASKEGALFALSTLSSAPLEDVAAACDGPKWFQLYIFGARDSGARLVHRAEKAGYDAVVLTVDVPVLGRRERSIRTGYTVPVEPGNFAGVPRVQGGSGSAMFAPTLGPLEAGMTWGDLRWLGEQTSLPIVIKGIHHPDDAALAVEHGAAGVVVSNHGGRQLDGAIATADALPGVVEAVRGRAEVWVDGGIRRGVDVLRALALGAHGVLVGRPVVWGLGAGGEDGVRGVIGCFRRELDTAMALAGAADLKAARSVRVVRGP